MWDKHAKTPRVWGWLASLLAGKKYTAPRALCAQEPTTLGYLHLRSWDVDWDVMGVSLHLGFGAKFRLDCAGLAVNLDSSGEHLFFSIGTSSITNGNRDFRMVAYPRHIPLMSCFSTLSFCHRPNFSNKTWSQLLRLRFPHSVMDALLGPFHATWKW